MKYKKTISSLILLIGLGLGLYYFSIEIDNSTHLKSKKDNIPPSVLTPEQFGAKGNGRSDDTNAIKRAISSLGTSGGTILFSSGKTYRITDTIEAKTNVELLSSDYNSKAKIYMDSTDSTKPAFSFTGIVKKETTIEQKGITMGANSIRLADNQQIKTGDLILIESNQPWYYDPRIGYGDLHKGELHRVIGKASKNSILLDFPIWDNYFSSEAISVKIIKPTKVTISGLEIVRKKSNNNTIGIKLKYCLECTVKNVKVQNASNIGIFLVSTYKTSIEHSKIEGANYSKTGYGIQTYGTSFSLIRDNLIIGSRRGIDLSGSYPDNNSIVEYNRIYGGGSNTLGNEYISEEMQYGIGTHSTANNTVFRGNTIGDLNFGINIRSQNVSIYQNNFIGYIKGAAIILAYGENVTIEENKLSPLIDQTNYREDIDLPNVLDKNQVNTFLYISRAYNIETSSIVVKNNQATNLSKDFIRLINSSESRAASIKYFEINHNRIHYDNGTSSKQFFINSDFPVKVNEAKHGNNHIDRSPTYSPYNNIKFKLKK